MRIDDHGVFEPVPPEPPRDAAAQAQVDAIAEAAAEAVALISHHRAELRATVAELTALQRDVRAEIRELADLLDQVAAVAPADAPASTTRARRWRRGA